MATQKELNASNLKGVLWDTLNDLRANTIQPGHADSVASQAREILVIRQNRLERSLNDHD